MYVCMYVCNVCIYLNYLLSKNIYLYIEVYFLDKHKGVHIPKPIIYYFTKSFWATLNGNLEPKVTFIFFEI